MPFTARRHAVALADVGAGGEAPAPRDLLEEQQRLDGLAGVRERLRRRCDGVAETLCGRVDGCPQAVVVVVDVPAGREIARDLEVGVAEHPVAVVPQPHVLLHQPGFLREGHRAQLDVRDARARAHPDAAGLVGDNPQHVIVRQVAPAAEVLEAIPRGRLLVEARQSLGASGPGCAIRRPGGGGGITGVSKGRRDGRVVERMKRPDLLRIGRERDGLGRKRDDGQPRGQGRGDGPAAVDSWMHASLTPDAEASATPSTPRRRDAARRSPPSRPSGRRTAAGGLPSPPA